MYVSVCVQSKPSICDKRWEGKLRIGGRQASPLPLTNMVHIYEKKKTIYVYKKWKQYQNICVGAS